MLENTVKQVTSTVAQLEKERAAHELKKHKAAKQKEGKQYHKAKKESKGKKKEYTRIVKDHEKKMEKNARKDRKKSTMHKRNREEL